MKSLFLNVVCIVCLLCSCYEQKKERANLEKKQVGVEEMSYSDSMNVITDNHFQSSIDSLQMLWLNSEQDSYLKILENIAAKSDGEASEYMDVTLVNMFKMKPAPLVAYLDKNKKSALYNTLVNGLGAELFVYSKGERIVKKRQLEEDAIKLSKARLTASQLVFMSQLFRDVIPEKFD